MLTVKIDPSRVEYRTIARPDDTPIEGNASAIDPVTDRETEDWIRAELDSGNDWAWASVTVEARYPGLPFVGEVHLGCCSYTSQSDFEAPGGYYDDMKAEALADLMRQAEEALSGMVSA